MSKQQAEAGKGSAPRKQRDDEAYSKGWDAIFRRNRGQTETPKANSTESSVSKEASSSKETQ
jgi:hypothetical protein